MEKQLDPVDFVEGLKKQGKRVSGIGHRIKSKDNRDARVELLQQYARKVGMLLLAGLSGPTNKQGWSSQASLFATAMQYVLASVNAVAGGIGRH